MANLPVTSADVASVCHIWDIHLDELMELVNEHLDERRVKDMASKLEHNIVDDDVIDQALDMFCAPRVVPDGIRAVIMPLCDKCNSPILNGCGVVLPGPVYMVDEQDKKITKDGQSAYHVRCLKMLLDQHAADAFIEKNVPKPEERRKP